MAIVIQIHDSGAPAHIAGFDREAPAGHVVKVSFTIIVIKAVGIFDEMGLEEIQVAVQIAMPTPTPIPACSLPSSLRATPRSSLLRERFHRDYS